MSKKKEEKKGKRGEKNALVPRLRFPEFRDAGEWDGNTFGGAASFLNGRAYKQDELLDKGKYRVLRVGNFFSNNQWYYSDLELEENKYCDNGDLLYAWSASFGPRIWQGEKVIYHYHIWKVLEKSWVDRNFLFILLGYETERMKSQSANGLGLMHITKGAIESWKCFIPKIDEQKKIASCFSSLDELITVEAQKLATLKAHKKGLMQQLFPAEGETVPKLRFPEFRDTGEWGKLPLSKLVNSLDAGVSVVSGDRPAKNSESGILKTSAVTDGIFNPLENKVVLDKSELQRLKEPVCKNTIIISRMNTPALVGANAYVETSLENIFLPDRLWAAKPKSGTSIRFIAFLLGSEKGRAALSELATGTSGSMKNITKSDVLALEISVPLFPEQQKIAACLTSIDELITAQTQKIETLKAHKKGLMQQLFPSLDEVQG
ncbi:MAG: restriction endonuclease subunit S [Candidatus Electrothrix scaldis]|nr:MAG: restriction endonuclease subunit S [Candidatus Electrothrix sp. GW3-3]